jgi:hypothetical protein
MHVHLYVPGPVERHFAFSEQGLVEHKSASVHFTPSPEEKRRREEGKGRREMSSTKTGNRRTKMR